MQAAKRLTLRVKEDFFRLEYGATSETSKSGLLEEHGFVSNLGLYFFAVMSLSHVLQMNKASVSKPLTARPAVLDLLCKSPVVYNRLHHLYINCIFN